MAGTTKPTRATGKYILHDVGDDDVRTQLAKLTRQLEMLTTKKVHEVTTKEVEPCRLCEGVEHSTHDCPSIPVLKESFNQGEHVSVNAMNPPNKSNSPFSNTYNPGWRSHPNFSWRENQNQNQGNFNNPLAQNQFQNQYPPLNQQGYGPTNFAPQSGQQGQLPYQAPHLRSNSEDTLNAFMQKQNDVNSQNAQTLQSHTQALNDIRSHLSKLTTSMGVAQNERGKFPSQPQPNPQGQHSVGSSNEGHMEHLKAVTTLRSGREVDKTNTTGLRAAPIPSYGERPNVSVEKLEEERNVEKDESVENDQVGGKAHEGVGVRNNEEGKNVVKESRLRAPKKPNHDAEIYKLFEQVKINIPLLDAVKQIPAYAKFLKDLCTVKRTLNVKDKAFLMEQVSSIIQAKTAPKYKDPGCPTVSIVIGATTIEHALLDLGASVNLLPYTVYKKLGLGELKPTSVTLQLADRSVRIPRGIIEDVLVQVDKFYFPADFIVLDTQPVSDPDAQIPVILGRPFLATSDAIIQCRNGRVKFSFGNMTCDLKIFDVARQVGDEGSIHEVNYIDTIVQHHIDTNLLSDPLLTCLVNPPTTDYSLSPEVKHIYSLINVEEVQEI
ncbi:uncharacterized protein LOC130773154 [Actinidia eriantha]|uniref:uncharacterized protein LOC130773154 n=1 Tax=Actinidia eriantha TaxID=165200 RepID=UPI00258F8331|nr:uncharacterized protein LOC130773154 [Actinidia eriantha]